MNWLPEAIQERAVIVLAHFVWQGVAIAALLAVLVAVLNIKRPSTRYASSLVAFLLMTLCPVVTWCVVPSLGVRDVGPVLDSLDPSSERVTEPSDVAELEWSSTAGPRLEPFDASTPERLAVDFQITARQTQEPATTTQPAEPSDWRQTLRPYEPWIIGVWLCGVALFSLRLLCGAIGVWRWRRSVELVPESLNPVIERLWAALSLPRLRFGLHFGTMAMPRVRICRRVSEAVAIGLFKPMILLPAAWVMELPADMLEAVLAHELAHVRRLDLWVNLLQRLVETLLFYHPAVWWLSRRLRIERELCCDELAAEVTRDRVRYAETLEHVARWVARPESSKGVGLNGELDHALRIASGRATDPFAVAMIGREGVLLHRIRQLLGVTPPARFGSAWLAGLLTLAFVLTLALGTFVSSRAEVERPIAESKVPPLEFRIAVTEPDRKANDVAWFPIVKPKMPPPAGKSGLDLPIEVKQEDQWRGLLWDNAEHAPLADGTWQVAKCVVVERRDALDEKPHYSVQFTLDAAGGAAMTRLTQGHLTQRLAIVVDGTIIAAPTIHAPIGESGEITGSWTNAEAEKLAAVFRRPIPRKKPGAIPAKYSAKLPTGATVELIGVGTHPAGANDWWMPNGSGMPRDPRDPRSHQISFPRTSLMPMVDCRKFVVRVTGLPEVDLGSVTVIPTAHELTCRISHGPHDDETGRAFVNGATEFTIISLPSQLESKTVTLRIGMDELKDEEFVRSIGPDGKKMGDEPGSEAARRIDELIQPKSIRTLQGRTELSLQWATGLSQPVAFDTNHERNEPIITNRIPGREIVYQFPIPLDRLENIEFRQKKFRYWVTFENVALNPGEQTDVKVKVEPLAAADSEAIAQRFVAALRKQSLAFLDESRLQMLQSELRDDFAKFSRSPLSDKTREALLKGIDAFVIEHFHGGNQERVYLEFRDEFETLKWVLRIAANHPPLTDAELERLKQQRQWMVDPLEKMPESPKFGLTRKAKLEQLNGLLNDPLNPFFAYPMAEPKFAEFQKLFDKRAESVAADKRLSFAVSWLLHEAMQLRAAELLREWPITNYGYQRNNTRWSLIATRARGNSSLHLEDARSHVRDVYVDVMRMVFNRGDAPADLAARKEWLDKQEAGDLCFDEELDALVGVRGTKLAVLDASSWYEADRVALADLRQLIQTRGAESIPMSAFAEPKSVEQPAEQSFELPGRAIKKSCPSLVVQTGRGDIAVIRLIDVDPVIIKSRPRPLPPNPPLHAGDAPEENAPADAQDQPRNRNQLEGVIDDVSEKAISFADGKVIATDAATKYERLTDQGEQPAERKELKAGVRVRYEFAKGKAVTKIVILPVKQDANLTDPKKILAEPIKHAAKLPNGVEVELAGIAMANVAYPDQSKRRKDDAWWRADGTRLQAPPMKLFSSWVDESQKDFREFAIKVIPTRDATSFTASHVTWTPHPIRGSHGEFGWDESDGKPGFSKQQHTAGFKDEKAVAVHVFVSDQPLGPAWLIDVNGRALPQNPADAKTEQLRKLINIVGVEKSDKETIFRSKRLPTLVSERLEFNLRAIDRKDQPHSSSESRGSEAGEGRVFKLAAAEIKYFEIRLRPMTWKVTFENVSLVPGQKTDVTVKVEAVDPLAPTDALVTMVDNLSKLLPGHWRHPRLVGGRTIEIMPGMYTTSEHRPHVVLVFTDDKTRPAMKWERQDERYEYLGESPFGHGHLFVSMKITGNAPKSANVMELFDWPEATEFMKAFVKDDRAKLAALKEVADNREWSRNGWGPIKNGIRSRWVLYSNEGVGKPITVGLEFYNFDSSPRTFSIRQAHPWRSWEVLGPAGKPVAFRPGKPIMSDEWYTLQTTSSLVLFGGTDIAQLFDLSRPGRYTLRFNGQAVRDVPDELKLEIQADRSLPAAKDFTFQVTEPRDLAGEGFDFLKPYPKLHGLSLDMTEPQFLEIITKQGMKTRKTVERNKDGAEKVTHHIGLGDGHTLIVMFDKDAKCSGIQRVRGGDPMQRRVSLKAEKMSLQTVLGTLARQAGLKAEFDVEALKTVELDVQQPISVTLEDVPLHQALGRVIDWQQHSGAMSEVRGGTLLLTTLETWQQRIAARLPEWMKPLYRNGLSATLDDNNEVESVTTSSIATDELLAKFASLPQLKELHIEVTKDLTPAGLAQLGKMSHLEKLSLYSVNTKGPELGDEIIRGVAGLKSLRSLSIHICGVTDEGAKLLEQLPQLTSLSLQEPRLTDAALKSIGTLSQLESLSLNSYVGTERLGWMRFSAAGIRQLRPLKRLTSLHLVGQEVTADDLDFPQLTSLWLGHPSVDDAVAMQVGKLRSLQNVILSYCQFGNNGLKAIASLPDLHRLDLSGSNIDDEGIEHLRSHKTLDHISLRVSGLTDRSLEHIAQIKTLTRVDLYGSGEPGFAPGHNFSMAGLQQLKQLPKLETLYLTNCKLLGSSLGLKELSQLRTLSMMMCDITETDIDALEAALPNTYISHTTGGGSRAPKKLRQQFEKQNASSATK